MTALGAKTALWEAENVEFRGALKRALCDSDSACGRCRVIVRSRSGWAIRALLPLGRRHPVHWGMFGEIPDQKVDVICSPSQTIRPPAG